jgi:phage tail sheath gpL-like
MTNFNFKELAATPVTPQVAVETDFNTGATTAPALAKKLLLFCYKTAAGLAADNVAIEVTSLAQAIEQGGIGSQLAVMWEAASRVSARIPIWCLPYPENVGAVQATGTITVADGGAGATGSGTLAVYVAGRLFRAGIAIGDTPTQIGDALVALINAHYNLPVTAVNAAGVVTLTARNGGIGGNSIRYRSEVTGGIGITSTDAGAALATGATEGDPATALGNIEQQRFHHGSFNSSDSANALKVLTHFQTQSNATNQKWGRCNFPATGTRSAAETLVSGTLNDKRASVDWLYGSEAPEFELAAAAGALRAANVNRNQPLNDTIVPGIVAPSDETLWPNAAEIEAALENGVTAWRPRRDGRVEMVRAVIAVTPPPAFRDDLILEISDYQDEAVIARVKAQHTPKALKSASPAGTPRVTTPGKILATVHEELRIQDEDLDYVQGTDAIIKSGRTGAQVNATRPDRVDVWWDFQPVQNAANISMGKTYTTP